MCCYQQLNQSPFSNLFMDLLGGMDGYAARGASGYFINALNTPQPDENGWYEYIYAYPPDNVLLQFERRVSTVQNPFPQITRWIGYHDFDPAFNVANLYWRWTGIGKQQKENVCP